MKKKIIFIFLFIILIILYLFSYDTNVHEEIYEVNNDPSFSGDQPVDNNNEYDIYVTDSTITFYDTSGNSIVYTFENDRLTNVFNIYVAENEVEARKIAAFFVAQIGNGEILDVKYSDNIVSVYMDMNCFFEYKDFTKKQIEEILLKDAKVVEEE